MVNIIVFVRPMYGVKWLIISLFVTVYMKTRPVAQKLNFSYEQK